MARRSSNKFMVAAGVIVCILSVILGLYLGLWVCIVGGIKAIVTGFTLDPWNAGMIAVGVLRFMCAGVVGWLTVILGWGAGTFLIAVGE